MIDIIDMWDAEVTDWNREVTFAGVDNVDFVCVLYHQNHHRCAWLKATEININNGYFDSPTSEIDISAFNIEVAVGGEHNWTDINDGLNDNRIYSDVRQAFYDLYNKIQKKIDLKTLEENNRKEESW